MKILIVDELCYPQLGGQQVRFKELAEQWVRQGNTVQITAIDHLGTSKEKENINGVVYYRLIKDATYYKNGLFGRKISSIIRYTISLKPIFNQSWDLIIFNQFPILPQLYYRIFYKKGVKTVLDFVEHRNSYLWKKINKQIINSADKVICISKHIKSCTTLYRKDNQAYVIPSLVDTKYCRSDSKTYYIFFGRLENHKHPDHAIEAVLNYNKIYNKEIQIHILGQGSMYEPLKLKYSTNDLIIFHGSVDDIQKDYLLKNARLLILPSEREGLPKVVIEAMAYGVPTVTTNYLGNGTQYFVKEEKIGAVAEPVINNIAEKILEVESNYEYFVSRCNEIKFDYDLESNSKKYLEIAIDEF